MTTWHVEEAVLARYAQGDLDEARVFSIEAHLIACDVCRTALSPQANPERLERMWSEVVEAVDSPRPGPVERILRALGVKDHLARLLAATPSLRLSWFGAVAVALGFSVLAAHEGHGSGGLVLFLAVAPLLPVLGVAVAYGPGVDPTHEIGVAAPMRSFRLLMIRAVAVLLSTTILAGAAALLLPTLDWTVAAWLLPSLGLTAASLALATVAPPLQTGGVVAFLWLAVVAASLSRPGGPIAPQRVFAFRPAGQIAFLALAVAASAAVAIRREALERQKAG
ncbi:MAG TPA: zf-HC2 domain-containing protein [Actinomycetota bacterium]